MLLLEAQGVTIRLGGRAIVRSVDLRVSAGEVVGVFGPSGAGKSTLFRALAGELALTKGRIALRGEDVSSMPLWKRARRGLGYLPQTPSVLWDLTVSQNLAVFSDLARGPGGATRDPASRAGALLHELGLAERAGVFAASLSGGERRTLELARALCAEPCVLLCDEPFSAIDPHGAARIGERLRRLADQGAAVVIADHHVAEALRLCDRAALLVDGEMPLSLSPDEFIHDALVRERYVALRDASLEAPRP